MEGTPIPLVPLPEGYEMTSVNYMIKGLCPDCARRNKKQKAL
jgi:Fur family ferric uptake transcriptional regulator